MAWRGAVVVINRETLSESKHRPMSLVPRWVTSRVLSDKSSPHVHTCPKSNHTLSISNKPTKNQQKQLTAIVSVKRVYVRLTIFFR